MKMHDLVKNPEDTPDKYGLKYVLAQVADNDEFWVPQTVVYDKGWISNEFVEEMCDKGHKLKTVAWWELPYYGKY